MLTVQKNLVQTRASKSGNGINLIIGGAFCYFDQAEYERIMANDTISGIQVTDPAPLLDKDTGEDTGRLTCSVVQYIVSDLEVAKEKLSGKVKLAKLAKGLVADLDADTAALLTSLGITI